MPAGRGEGMENLVFDSIAGMDGQVPACIGWPVRVAGPVDG